MLSGSFCEVNSKRLTSNGYSKSASIGSAKAGLIARMMSASAHLEALQTLMLVLAAKSILRESILPCEQFRKPQADDATSSPVRPLIHATIEVDQIHARLLQGETGRVQPLDIVNAQLSQLARLPQCLNFGRVPGERRVKARSWRRSPLRHERGSTRLQMAAHLLPYSHKRRLERS